MGLRDVLTGRHQLSKPAPDRLFALSTAYVTLESEYSIKSSGVAGIVFQPLATSDFESIVKDMQQVVQATAADSGATVTTHDDDFGFRWMELRTPGLEDLVVGVNAVSSALETGGYGERILCAVFAFADEHGAPLYFIYNYKRGFWYPFVPAPGEQQRSTEHELQLKAQIGSELPVEPELERWFPLWGIPF
jgi:hypothetical protein